MSLLADVWGVYGRSKRVFFGRICVSAWTTRFNGQAVELGGKFTVKGLARR